MALLIHPRVLAARVARAATSPYYRYRYAPALHAVRVGLAMLASILVTTGIDIPNGIWASVTVLTVIGGLQHHGNIRKRALERALGTVLGALVGLLLLFQLHVIGSMPLTFVLMSIAAGVCGYFAIGRAGYVALLTAITICIVAGHGDSTIDMGLWRTLNVLIGIVLALAFSFALPLYATYSWRYLLARNLRDCAQLYTRIVTGAPIDEGEQLATFAALGQRLVKLRALMPSVAKEIDLPLKDLESIQHLHRSLLSALEMMSAAAQAEPHDVVSTFATGKRDAHVRTARATLIVMARSLRFGSNIGVWRPAAEAAAPAGAVPAGAVPAVAPSSGPQWVARRFAEQVDTLRMLLAQTEAYWNIERRQPARP
ncbi:FUSC family protein [Trinickia caryophylli]|uniref:Fusaric acid resistance protein family protein n=1 Tax=Trinickia caryophylli TaxID=28094 RepID=A0A1X7GU22_TRICW|nr:FUSC family protein [Trinickia caryophylli]PMS08946.1 hypothetical protein C0Z17_27685 [Trinickia caryophylli]TRX18156.1 FUSC family protein [Trinickia caryophylli]WQE11059.1 FUSC family protein [Trinickia caryophylli]SMF74285.1 Fusaric acid resistance protein family protein [Trinickia caryophylli]GLU35211.1 FUSC family protein [Trinickia caryophylli]